VVGIILAGQYEFHLKMTFRIHRLLLPVLFVVPFATLVAQDGKSFVKEAEKLQKNGQLKEALEQYGFAIRVDSNYAKALIGRASLYLGMDSMAARMADLEHVARLTPRDAGNLTLAAAACVDAKAPARAVHYADQALALAPKNMEALQTKVRACLALKDVQQAVAAADAALALKATTDTYYLHALARMASGDYTTADADLDKVLEWNPLYEAAYVASGEAQLKLHESYRGTSMQMRALEKAIDRCTAGLQLNPSSTELLIVRSKAYAKQKEFAKAIDDVSKCVALGREDSVVYYQRALYYHGFGQEQNAVNDLNKLLLLYPDNVSFLLLRAECREANLDLDGAANDLSMAEKGMKGNPAYSPAELKKITESKERIKARVFEMNREADPPVITVVEPLRKDDVVQVSSALANVKVAGHIRDKSLLKSIQVQGKNADFDPEEKSPEFRANVPLAANAKEITVMAEDVYGNRSTTTLKVQRTEADPPVLAVTSPAMSADRVALLPAGKEQVFVEGRASDPSGIRSVMVDGMFASFIPDTTSTDFSIKLDLNGKDHFTVRAEDRYGNVAETAYMVQHAAPVQAAVAPKPAAEKPASAMGTAWIVYIENSNYRNMPALPNLGPDKMHKAFAKYQAQRTIVKKDLSKTQLERFFNIELRDMVRNGDVNTLLVWYEGAGRSQGGKAYWIPVDGKSDDIYTFYNYGPLKGLMENYSESIRTTLVVSDAAGNDPSFYELTR
jgi:tetratricopeptide (TPR) repeat protein